MAENTKAANNGLTGILTPNAVNPETPQPALI